MKKNNISVYKRIKISWFHYLPMLIGLFFAPLALRGKVVTIPLDHLVWVKDGANTFLDTTMYNKAAILIIGGVISFILFLYHFVKKEIYIPSMKLKYFLIGYLGLIVLSTIFSTNFTLSLHGYKEHYEGIFVLFSYILLFSYTSLFVNSDKMIDILIKFWAASMAFMFIIGFSQFIGYDLLGTGIFKAFTLPDPYRKANIQHSISSNAAYQTLFNRNFVSFYAAISLPFSLWMFLKDKRKSMRYIYLAMFIMSLLNQVFSLSLSGYIGIAASLIIILIFNQRAIKDHLKYIVTFSALIIAIIITFISFSNSLIAVKVKSNISTLSTQTDYRLNDIYQKDNQLIIDHDDFIIHIVPNDTHDSAINGMLFVDSNGEALTVINDDNGFTHTIRINEKELVCNEATNGIYDFIQLSIDDMPWYITYSNPHFMLFNPIGEPFILEPIRSYGFDGYERIGSKRGYIWSRSIPLLSQHLLLGSGPGTFPLIFPQNDLIGKYQAYGNDIRVVDSPHNIYLGYGIQTGILSLLCLLGIWIGYITWSFKLYIKNDFSDYFSIVGVASLSAVIGYLTSGFFNESNIAVTGLFWIILGLGFASNIQVSLKQNKKASTKI